MTYSQQGQESVKDCPDCKKHGQITKIIWRPNPAKPGFKPGTNKPYMIPVEVNTQERHNCQYYNPTSQQTTGTGTSTNYGTVQVQTTPRFTPNDKTGEKILNELEKMVKQNEQMIEYLEVLAEGKIKSGGIKPASEIENRINLDGRTNVGVKTAEEVYASHKEAPIPPEHQEYRENNTAYRHEEDQPDWK